MKRNIAVVWGGDSSEKIVSAKSMKGICSFLDAEKYNIFPVKIDREGWFVEHGETIYTIDKNDFSFVSGSDNKKISFDFAYIIIHGTPGEDGKLQGYLDMLGIPYSGCGVMAASLTFNKYICNNYLKSFGIAVSESVRLLPNEQYDIDEIIEKLGLPLFVKPNTGGSSFATTKIKQKSQMQPAIDAAFKEGGEVIIERFVKGREVTCGCYKTRNGVVLLPLTEVVTENEFFDYDAKYEGQVQEITPARISSSLTKQIQTQTSWIYDLVEAKGIIRADYIIDDNDKPWLLEVNTTPGMTLTSFIPQQIKSAGLNIQEVLTDIIENEYPIN